MKEYKLELLSDFNQIQIYDKNWGEDDDPIEWTDEELANFISVANTSIV